MEIFNKDVTVLGDLTLNTSNSAGNILTLDTTGVVRFRTPLEVINDLSISLDDLIDVNITTPVASEFIKYNGSSFVNAVITESDISDLQNYELLSNKGLSNGYTPLDSNSKIPNQYLPALAITETFVVPSEASMLSLPTAETGDVAVRTDENKSYILQGSDPSVLTDWQELLSPTDAVQSVNGLTGTVTLNLSFNENTGDLGITGGNTLNLDGRYLTSSNIDVPNTQVAIGTGSGIEGNSNFTYDGSTLEVEGLYRLSRNNTGTYTLLNSMYVPNMFNGTYAELIIGKEESLYNRGTILFNYVGNNSSSNNLGFGFFGNAPTFLTRANGDSEVKRDIEVGRNAIADSFITQGGSSSQFVKGDGTLDSNSYSVLGHTHTESDITDLQSYLLDISGESLSSLLDVTITTINSGNILRWNGTAWINNTLAEAGIANSSDIITNHTLLSNIGTNTHAQIDTHISNSGIHFTEASINHANIVGVGTNSHAQIDSHIADSNIHFSQTSILISESQITDLQNYLLSTDIDTFSELNAIVSDATLSKQGDNISQFVNDAGYITSFSETDTLQTVTSRGSSTNIASSFTSGISVSASGNETLSLTRSGNSDLLIRNSGSGDLSLEHSGSGSILIDGFEFTIAKANNWETAFSWGDHSVEGYLLSSDLNGYVNNSGTPVNNQLAIFTDSDTIEGDPDITWDGSTFEVNGLYRVSRNQTSTYTLVNSMYVPNMGNNRYAEMIIGKEESLYNRGTILFHHVSSGNTNNNLGFGFFGNAPTFKTIANGDSEIQRDLTTGRNIIVEGRIFVESTEAATTDTDQFLVLDSNEIKYRTGAQILSDVGAQASLTNPVTGTGTTNYLSKFTGTSTLGNSLVFDNGTNVGIGTTNPSEELHIQKSSPSGEVTIEIENTDSSSASTAAKLSLKTGLNAASIRAVSGSGGAGYLQFYNESSERMRITSTGNVGIGTTSPSYKLDLNGDARLNGVTFVASGASRNISTHSSAGRLQLNGGTSSSNGAYIEIAGDNYSTGDFVNIFAGKTYISGNVGIGNTSPPNRLDVNGNISATSLRLGSTASGEGLLRYNPGSGSGVGVTTGALSSANIKLFVANGGNVGVGTTSPGAKLEVNGTLRIKNTGNELQFANANVAIQRASNNLELGGYDNIVFKSSNTTIDSQTERMRITSTGYLGIGTTGPVTTLHVEGTNASTYSTSDSNEFENAKDTSVIINNSTTGTYANIFMASQGPAGKATGRIFLVNQGTGKSAFTFQLRDSSHTGETREKMRINGSGKVSIGNTNDAYELDVTGEGRFTGDVRGLSFITTSQRDQKEGIKDITKTKTKTIQFKEFTYKSSIDKSARKRYGVVAEDIENDYPELVHTGEDGIKGVNYVDLLVKRVAELEKELEDATGGFTGNQTIVVDSKGTVATMTYENGLLKTVSQKSGR